MNVKLKQTSMTNIIVIIMFMFASLDLFQFAGKTFFFYLGIIFLLYSFAIKGKIYILKDPLIVAIFAEFFISGILAQFGDLNNDYKKTALIMPIMTLFIFFEAGIFESLIKKNEGILQVILKGVKIACIIQFVYIPLQYVAYHYSGVDINKEIFVNLFGVVENASFIRDWIWYPSGFTIHSAIVAPLMVIGMVLFDKIYMKLLIFVDAILCGSSSALVGVTVVIILSFFLKLLKKSKGSKLKKNALFVGAGIIVIVSVVLVSSDILSLVFEKFGYIATRLFSPTNDSSTSAHLYYILDYPRIFSNNGIITNLFGCGYNCSGSIFSILYNRSNVGTWAVESEVMDRLYSLGIIGFLLYNTFLIKITVKGMKLDSRYAIIMIAIIIQGFGYNLQWDYVFLLELIFYICIKKKINIFEYI